MGPDPSLTPDIVASQSFTTSRRGCDPAEVKTFLGRVATELRELRERAAHFESAWHSAEERAARPPVLDEETLMAAVGEETATVVRAARSAAADIRSKAEADAEKALEQARAEAERIKEDAAGVLAREKQAAEEASERIVSAARAEAAEILDRTRIELDQLRAKAESDRQMTIEGANATRDRILEDLSRRRRVATVQIEQLRAGRERLIESYAVVRRTLEEAQSELSRADAEARKAADEVGRRMRGEAEPHLTDLHFSVEQPGGATTEVPDVREDVSESSGGTVVGGADEAPPTSEEEDHGGDDRQAEQTAESSRSGGVAELFAKLRSGHEQPPNGKDSPTEAADPADRSEAEPARRSEAEPARRPEAEPERRPEAEPESAGDEPVSDGDESLLQRRESVVIDLEVNLTRKLKRALQDEQNALLDRLRGLRGERTAARLLPDLDAQIARYTKASADLVDKAAKAGVRFATEALADGTLGDGTGDEGAAPGAEDLAADAAHSIVDPLRRRLEQAIDTGAEEDQAVLVETVGAAYREWKSQRIERIAGDVLSAAFSRGTWHATPEGVTLRWIVEDTDGPCPDCDDDSLAGMLPKGEAFPTGQHYPPAHSGCRCLLVPVAG